MPLAGIIAQLAHISQHGDATAVHGERREHGKRGRHGIRVRIVRIIDDGHAVGGVQHILTAGFRLGARQRRGCFPGREAQLPGNRRRRAGVMDVMQAAQVQ